MTPATRDRALLVLAAVLWSTGSLFVRLFRESAGAGLHDPALTPLHIALFRGLFAGLALVPLVRFRDVRVRPAMLPMMLCFAAMSGMYMTALALGSAANAILLQNSAPVWVYLVGVYLLGEAADPRTWRAILVAFAGTLAIVAGNWPWGDTGHGDAAVLLMGAGSGVTYAGVVLFLRGLRDEDSAWLMVLNLFASAAVIAAFLALVPAAGGWPTGVTLHQLAVLAVYGAVQMAAPYWLFARGLRTVSPAEAGMITLVEPVLNAVWAYLITPDTDTPSAWTLLGGGLLLGALAWRYAPRRTPKAHP